MTTLYSRGHHHEYCHFCHCNCKVYSLIFAKEQSFPSLVVKCRHVENVHLLNCLLEITVPAGEISNGNA